MQRHSGFIAVLTCLGALGICVSEVSAETITLIGTGNVGAALGERFAGLGHRIVSGSRTPEAGVNFQLRPEPS